MEIAGSDGVYVDTTGKKVIDKNFYRGWDFSEGLADGFAKIEIEGKIGYTDHSGRFAISPQFRSGNSFKNGMARVILDELCSYPQNPCRCTFIDKTGRVLTGQRYEEARDFAEGRARSALTSIGVSST
jgi:WG containing repeat